MPGQGQHILVAGPCMLEGPEVVEQCARHLAQFAHKHPEITVFFKGSFDKANRTNIESPRGPGLEVGLALLTEVSERYGLMTATDVHQTDQVAPVAAQVDMLQIPAFLSRQTDLIEVCAESGRWLNIKKGQFMDAQMAIQAHEKALAFGAKTEKLFITERGTSFGYGDLIVDFRTQCALLDQGIETMYDTSHSVQKPAGQGSTSGGTRQYAIRLAAASKAIGVRHFFVEFHPRPDEALSDSATQLSFAQFDALTQQLYDDGSPNA